MARVSRENRTKAREHAAARLEKIKRQEDAIAELLSGIDEWEAVEVRLGRLITQLRALDVKGKEIEELTGFSNGQQGRFVRLFKEGQEDVADESAETVTGGDQDAAAEVSESSHDEETETDEAVSSDDQRESA